MFQKTLLAIGLSAVSMAMSFALEGWETNMDAAKKKAVEEKKGLLIEFTGSDWCPPCIQMRTDVLSKKEFLDAAQKGFVLVELDYPNKPLSAEQTEHNAKYAKDYGIEAYPTVIFTDAEGRPVRSFVGGRDLTAILEEINKAGEDKVAIQNNMTKLKDAKGEDRKKIVDDLLNVIPTSYLKNFYPDLFEEGKDGSSDAAKAIKQEEQLDDLANYMESAPEGSLNDPQQFYDYLGKYLQKDGLLPPVRQEVLSIQANLLMQMSRLDDALKAFDSAIACDPESAAGKKLAAIKANVLENKDSIARDMEQQKQFRDYTDSLGQDVVSDPERYKEALVKYLAEHDLSPEVRVGIVQQIAVELIGLGKTDRALEVIQQEIDSNTKAGEKSMIDTLTALKEYITENKEKLEQELKKK